MQYKWKKITIFHWGNARVHYYHIIIFLTVCSNTTQVNTRGDMRNNFHPVHFTIGNIYSECDLKWKSPSWKKISSSWMTFMNLITLHYKYRSHETGDLAAVLYTSWHAAEGHPYPRASRIWKTFWILIINSFNAQKKEFDWVVTVIILLLWEMK